jgi:hypothetical protein
MQKPPKTFMESVPYVLIIFEGSGVVQEEPTREYLLEELEIYKALVENASDMMLLRNKRIFTTVLEHLNRGIKKTLISIHTNYSYMLSAMKRFDKDRESAILMIETWVPRDQDLRPVAIESKHDVNKPLNL